GAESAQVCGDDSGFQEEPAHPTPPHNPQQNTLIKSLSPRVMLSNHLLPKGTKMKVNLEDQGRQKVSFSFAQTKKPLQSLFFIPRGQNIDKTHSQTVISAASKLKTDLTKMHFKKQILSVSVTEDNPTSIVPEEPNSSELQAPQKSTSPSEFPAPHSQNAIYVCPSENTHTEALETKAILGLKKPDSSSGKDGESSCSAEQDSKVYKRKTRYQSDSAPPGSESDGDSAQMSSTCKSVDSKRKTSSDNRSKEVKKSSFGSHAEEKDKGFSKRSEVHEMSSSYSKSDRDSRYTSLRSSRSDKDRRRTRSRSRSRSRGSRTSSSHSRSERSRGDRGSRSERSYYHDSDRRSHRSSPRRERRRSRSRTDRTRDSSDSEDDHRKTRTRTSDSSRSSAHSSSHKDLKSSSHSKSEKAYKSANSPHSSELDKRTQSSKSERTSKRLSDSDSQHKCSPDLDSSYRKSGSYHKSETNSKSSSSSMYSHSQTYEKRQKSSSSDSETDHKGKSQATDKSSGSEENYRGSQNKSSRSDSNQTTPSRSSLKSSAPDQQSNDTFSSPDKAPPCVNTTEPCSQSETELSDCQLGGNEHSSQTCKGTVSSTDKTLQDFSTNRKETKSGPEVENENASAISSNESLQKVNAPLENLTILKDNLSSNRQTHVNSSAAVLNSCNNNDSLVCSLEKKVIACSPGITSLTDMVDILVTHDAQQNSKPEIVELNMISTADKKGVTSVPLRSDSTCPESENQLSVKVQNMDTIKKSNSSNKKSRWDIVGQDTSDGDISQRTFCAEPKPTFKKVISVKKIEFSKDNSHQNSDIKDNIPQEAVTHSKLVKQTEKQEVPSESTLMSDKHRDQSKLSQKSTSTENSDLNLSVSQKTNTDKLLHINDTSEVDKIANMQSWIDSENKTKETTNKTKLSKRVTPNEDVPEGQSEASDSDNSEYDSDCGEAIKRLHSVVVVPKNSSLTIDVQDTGASPCTPMNSSELPNANIVADVNNIEVLKQRQGNSSTAFVKTRGPCAPMNESSVNSMFCQSQSNMIDSTSHSEGSNSISAKLCVASHISGHGSAAGPGHGFHISRQCEQGHKQHSMSSRDERMYSHYQPHDFRNADNIREKSLGWDLSQAEQPSSTYQQPDSSYGPQLPSTKLTGTSLKQQECIQSNVSWNHQTLNLHTSRKTYQHGHEHYQDPASEIHPDSLTNDHDDYSGDKPSNHSKTAVECSGPNTIGSSSFVQGHEISSNSKGSAVPDPPREDNFRPHRGRGPPKKRRPEVESDSDNEAEAGPTDKKACLGDDVSKEGHVKAEVQCPSLTLQDFQDANKWKEFSKSKKMPPYFDLIEENVYLTERKKSKSHRDIKRMQCECPVLPREERSKGVLACGEDCLNRLLMIECSSRCLNGVYCSNRRFQMKQHADFDVILTEDKESIYMPHITFYLNTFVLEYCGEVLDHKEFKTRVKEYARNKNIHYYFMSLKNNEIIDATLKGNCSRFMNHSCEPNCETQKWTVNGQLRVGFFTTKAVTVGTELTFDYQFQRYGKEAQKCFCGAPSCRGFLGGENRVSVRAAGGKMKKDRSRKSVDEELEALLENGEGLYDEKQVVSLCRLMVRQLRFLSTLFHFFLDHHGLSLLWIFMVELSEAKGNSSNNIKLQLEILKTLAVLPISTKNMLEESRVLTFIQRWAQTKTILQPAEMDGYSSENTSRAQTPLNTPDGSSNKLGPELDGDTSKPAVYRRLKIISENSLDSALSDASKASDGKEEEEEDDEEEEEETSHAGLPEAQPGESSTDAAPTSEIPETSIPSEVVATPVEPLVIGTPSQDEEEGVSDVESERSQEPQISALDISGMASRLLESWKDLKEVYRIPKKSQVEKEVNGKFNRSRDRDTTLTPRTASGSREREREHKTPRSTERRRRRSTSPPSSYERTTRRTEERNKTPRGGVGAKERNKLSTEERRKLFEQEVAQREAQKQQQLQQQQQQQLQTMAYDPALAYSSSPGFITYPPGYPIQTFVDPSNPNAGKVLLPTPSVEPTLTYEQTPPQRLISDMGLSTPSSTSQATPVSNFSQHITTTNLTTGNSQQYVQPTVATQDTGVAVLSVPAQTAPQVQGQQSYTTLWDPTTQQTVTVQAQPAQQYPTAPAQAQAAIYYQGQPCQTIYSIPTAYPQPNTPVIQLSSVSLATGGNCWCFEMEIHGFAANSFFFFFFIASPLQEMIVPNNVIDLPPPSPPKPKTIVLPPNWKVARDPEGKIYYYHIVTRQTQWDPPTWEGSSENTSVDHESEMDLGTPTYDENPSKFSTKTAEADTSSELAKKSKETFRKEMSQFIVQCLNPYRKPDCKLGRISNTEDFKHLARKLTHGVMNKELKACNNPEDLECNENVKHKTKEYIKKYMQRFGSVYRPKEDTEVY
uniref:[histone H3]-lysine(36) N-trimethyltransferase n=1 Tax=Mola mola TaxID=94237 RepID=A0A3Q3W306_MOLML